MWRENRRNGAGLAGRRGSPGGRVETFDKNLVSCAPHWRQKIWDCGSAQLRVESVECEPSVGAWGHGSQLLDL